MPAGDPTSATWGFPVSHLLAAAEEYLAAHAGNFPDAVRYETVGSARRAAKRAITTDSGNAGWVVRLAEQASPLAHYTLDPCRDLGLPPHYRYASIFEGTTKEVRRRIARIKRALKTRMRGPCRAAIEILDDGTWHVHGIAGANAWTGRPLHERAQRLVTANKSRFRGELSGLAGVAAYDSKPRFCVRAVQMSPAERICARKRLAGFYLLVLKGRGFRLAWKHGNLKSNPKASG